MSSRLRRVFLLGFLFLLGCGAEPSGEFRQNEERFRVVRESPYTTVVVERDGALVDLRFRLSRRAPRQSTVDLHDPENLILPYTRTMLAGAFVQASPRRILLIGLGGGTLNRFLRRAFPEAELTTVELDPTVLEVAREFMGYRPDEKEQIFIEDGRAFLKRSREKYDWILVDAYGSDSVPPHLKTREFYQLLLDRLTPEGVVTLNIHGGNKLFLSDQASLREVFPQVHLFAVPGAGNVVALAFASSPPDFRAERPPLASISDPSLSRLRSYLHEVWPHYQGVAKEDKSRVLTDDFAPAETLQHSSLK